MVSQALIEKFLQNKCTAKEREVVADYLLTHPEELEKYLGEKEWEASEAEMAVPSMVLRRLKQGVFEKKRSRTAWNAIDTVIRPVVLAKAACIGFLGLAGWMLFRPVPHAPVKAVSQVLSTPEQTDGLRHIRNTTAEKMNVGLPDGSKLALYPESEVSFDPRLSGRQRSVHLTGKAFFQVAQDRVHPFIVFSDVLATTALGTSFTVTCHPLDNTIKVYLQTGKVLVKPTESSAVKWEHDMYLDPHDLLIYDRRNGLATLLSGRRSLPGTALYGSNGAALPDWYMFDKQSLDQVFDQLSLYYGVDIDYYPSDVRKRFFTGKYVNRDSLDGIMRDIALLNRFSITKKGRRYEVRKRTGN